MPRFIMLVYAGPDNEGPTPEAVARMTRYNDELREAGALLALDGLHPPAAAASVTWPGGRPSVTDGPYAEAKEMVGGFTIIRADSREAALDWAKRCPLGEGDRIEVRQIAELEDYPEDVQAARGGR